VRVVSDSSPLITLSRIGQIDLLPALHRTITISIQVYDEIVVAGAGLAGSSEIAAAKWIEVRPVGESSGLSTAAREEIGIGVGELSTIILGRELKAHLILMDDMRARRAARREGLSVLGCDRRPSGCFQQETAA
jgi:uncharacterized protein